MNLVSVGHRTHTEGLRPVPQAPRPVSRGISVHLVQLMTDLFSGCRITMWSQRRRTPPIDGHTLRSVGTTMGSTYGVEAQRMTRRCSLRNVRPFTTPHHSY